MNTNKAPSQRRSSRPPRRAAFTLVEVVVAMLLVSVLLVAALSTVGASRAGQRHTLDQSLAANLAQNLLEEVSGQAYEDPDGSSGFGPEPDEPTHTRATFDDVDDYAGWAASPPTLPDGVAIDGAHRFRREVSVNYADLTRPDQTVTSDSGAKRVTVTVSMEGRILARATAIRSRSGP